MRKTLIIGGGAIGLAVKKNLEDRGIQSDVFDLKLAESSQKSLPEILGDYNLILGCTGTTSIPAQHHPCIAPGTALASISSSDRPIPAMSRTWID